MIAKAGHVPWWPTIHATQPNLDLRFDHAQSVASTLVALKHASSQVAGAPLRDGAVAAHAVRVPGGLLACGADTRCLTLQAQRESRQGVSRAAHVWVHGLWRARSAGPECQLASSPGRVCSGRSTSGCVDMAAVPAAWLTTKQIRTRPGVVTGHAALAHLTYRCTASQPCCSRSGTEACGQASCQLCMAPFSARLPYSPVLSCRPGSTRATECAGTSSILWSAKTGTPRSPRCR